MGWGVSPCVCVEGGFSSTYEYPMDASFKDNYLRIKQQQQQEQQQQD